MGGADIQVKRETRMCMCAGAEMMEGGMDVIMSGCAGRQAGSDAHVP